MSHSFCRESRILHNAELIIESEAASTKESEAAPVGWPAENLASLLMLDTHRDIWLWNAADASHARSEH